MLAHLGSVASVLRPGAAYIVGLSTTVYGVEQPAEDVWEGGRGTLRVKQVIQYLPPADRASRVERVISHVSASRPTGTEEIESTYLLRTYSLEEWVALVDRSPLRIEGAVDEMGDRVATRLLGYSLWVLKAR
jgi:hypothetical protein